MQYYNNIELVIVDDCSSDNSYDFSNELINGEFFGAFRKAKVLRNPVNMGAHNSINTGISNSTGTLLTILNSDDEFVPNRLSTIIEAMRSERTDFGFSLVNVISHKLDSTQLSEIKPFLQFTLRQMLDINRDITVGFSLLRKNVAVSTGNMVFSRSLYDRIGGFIPLKFCHDWDFILQSLFFCEPAVIMQPLYNYRLHPQNSFKTLSHMAEVETEIVMRRFFRLIIDSMPINSKCPSTWNWPGYFEQFIRGRSIATFFEREMGMGLKGWRTYER